MQHELTAATPLWDDQGHLVEAGWAREPFWKHQRWRIRAPWYPIKEWDYYDVLSDTLPCGIAITISDFGYAGLLAVCWIDFQAKQFPQHEVLVPLTRGTLGLDEDVYDRF